MQEMQDRRGFDPWVRKIPWGRKWQPTPLFLPGKSLGQRSLAGCSLWGLKELDTAEHTHMPRCFWDLKKNKTQPSHKITTGASLVAQTVENLPAIWQTQVWSLGWDSPGEGNGYLLLNGKFHRQRSLVGYVHGVTKSRTWLSDFHLTIGLLSIFRIT